MKTENGKKGVVRYRPLWTLLAPAVLILSACYVSVREPVSEGKGADPSDEVYVGESPPPPRSEVIVGVAPSPSHVWMGGRWALRPYPGAVWLNGRWDRHPHGYVWVDGRWR